jgi:predicted regulator of Ras-like GTPase activity (Roadblock/LC7/MglB family)
VSSRAEQLRDLLFSLTTRVREIRALSLVDRDGLPLVSTLASGRLDDSLAAFGGGLTVQLARAQSDFAMGPLYLSHIVGRDRQLFVIPVQEDSITLVALVEAHATPATITMHLLALARELLPLMAEPASDPGVAANGEDEDEPSP